MSKLFYDDFLNLSEVDNIIKKTCSSKEEAIELWQIIDEILYPRLMACLLARLPCERHEEFLFKFYQAPFDEKILDYLKEQIEDDLEKIIKKEVKNLKKEILDEIKKKR